MVLTVLWLKPVLMTAHVNEAKMLETLWFNTEKGIQRQRGIGVYCA